MKIDNYHPSYYTKILLQRKVGVLTSNLSQNSLLIKFAVLKHTMTKDLINFQGLYGDHKTPLLPDFIHFELLETRSKVYDWEIKEHLHTDLFQLFVLQEGQGILVSEQEEINLESPCIVTIPTNTLHGFHFQPNVKGEVITFSESFLESIFQKKPQLLLELNRLRCLDFKEHDSQFSEISVLQSQIIEELIEEQAEKQLLIQSLFQLLFIRIYRFILSQNKRFTASDNRTLQYFQAFQKSIKQSVQESKSIQDYAKELNITAVHLNRVCQQVAQKSALELVQEYLINEAKKYLLNTSYTIAEISYFLNFKDPAYFTRLFKKRTGVSPSEFRKN